MKKIIAATSVILVLTFFYYPVFDNEKISYAIILLCFIIICFSGAKIYSPGDKSDYDSFEKEMDRLQDYDGIFQYTDTGFYINKKDETEFIRWDEIIAVKRFTVPVFINERQSGLEIITDKKNYEFNDQQIQGIIKLTDQLSIHLPHWNVDAPTIMINNFGLEKSTFYEKNNL